MVIASSFYYSPFPFPSLFPVVQDNLQLQNQKQQFNVTAFSFDLFTLNMNVAKFILKLKELLRNISCKCTQSFTVMISECNVHFWGRCALSYSTKNLRSPQE